MIFLVVIGSFCNIISIFVVVIGGGGLVIIIGVRGLIIIIGGGGLVIINGGGKLVIIIGGGEKSGVDGVMFSYYVFVLIVFGVYFL